MKGKIIFKILEKLAYTAVDVVDLFTVFLTAGYGASYSKLNYELFKLRQARDKADQEQEIISKLRKRYQKMLSNLKTQGLIKEEVKNKRKFLVITPKGLKKLNLLKRRLNLVVSPRDYKKEDSNKLVIVIFDIPEEERRKRRWLREVLKNLGFKMVQKSVWVGKVKIPENFLKDLQELKIINFVEIFEITSSGSLKAIV